MLYEMTFFSNHVPCVNMVEAEDLDTAIFYFMKEVLREGNQFVGGDVRKSQLKPGMPIHKVPSGWKEKMMQIEH